MNALADLENIYRAAIRAVDPAELIRSGVQKNGRTLTLRGRNAALSEDLARYRQILLLGIGKASARMAVALENILDDECTGGFIITKHGHGLPLNKVLLLEAGHPVPDEKSQEGARIIAKMAQAADEQTLIINLISGGGSALCCLPADGITLEDKKETTTALLASGAGIDEVNCVRKHLSKIKGGGLARMASPARLINLILSDVIGDRLDTIASGITAPDPTTFADALAVVRKYDLENQLPPTVCERLVQGAAGLVPDTPKDGDPAFHHSVNIILGGNALACNAAGTAAENLGYHIRIVSTTLAGEASEAGAFFAQAGAAIGTGGKGPAKPAILIAGGETTVTIRGPGRGGRNQELALAFACELHRLSPGSPNIFFLSAGTDGSDGPTEAAGAFVTPALMEKMKTISAEAAAHLAANDSYSFFERHGGLFITGPTYTNVCDIQILAVV